MAMTLYPWQEELASQLLAMRDELPNGLLIYGPKGIGTIDLVIRYARSLFCETPDINGEPCGQCKGCKMANACTHPDLRYVMTEAESIPRHIPFDPPSNAQKDRKIYREILIHQPRELTDFLNQTAHEAGGTRIVVVYPADAIRADAAATFLKNLEEPPAKTTFLLVAEDIDRVLPTIRSRCRLLRAKGPSYEEAIAWLNSQGIGDADDALARASGRPCQIIDEKRIETDPEIDSKIKEQLLMLSSLPKQVRDDLLRVLSMGRDLPLDRIAVKDGRTALPVAAVLPVIYRWGYDLLAVQQGLKPHYFPQYGESMVKILKGVKTEHLYAWFDTLKSLQRTVNHPLNAQLVIEQTLLRYRRMMMGKAFD